MVDNELAVLNKFYEFVTTSAGAGRVQKVKTTITNCKKMIGKDLTKLKVDDVVRFLAELNKSDYSAWTKNDYKKIFKRFLKWYYKDLDMIEGDKVILGFKGSSKKRAFNKQKINKNTLITPEELEKLIRTAKALKWKALISFAYESAFRPCEIAKLKWEDIKFDDGRDIARVMVLSPKTGEQREIPVRDCIVHLKRWREEYQFPKRKDSDFVFPSKDRKELNTAVITATFRRLSKAAGMRVIFPYLLRHSRICELQKRLPEKIAAKFAGHSVETSEIYNHIVDEDVEDTMLKEIYATEEITPAQKNEYEARIKKLEDRDKKRELQMKEILKKIGIK